MATVHDFWVMWQGSENLSATQKESHAPNRQMTAVRYISETDEIVKAFWSLFQHDGAAVFKLSERSPLPPSLSAKNMTGGRIQIVIVRQIWRFNLHSFESEEDSTPESIADTENLLTLNGDLNNPNVTEDNCAADDKSDIEYNNGVEGP